MASMRMRLPLGRTTSEFMMSASSLRRDSFRRMKIQYSFSPSREVGGLFAVEEGADRFDHVRNIQAERRDLKPIHLNQQLRFTVIIADARVSGAWSAVAQRLDLLRDTARLFRSCPKISITFGWPLPLKRPI
jgi:hypothetical protein